VTRTVTACVDCGSSQVQTRAGGGFEVETDSGWYCRDCDAEFATPIEREPRGHGASGGSATAALLQQLDPEEVGDD